jgi:triacylglycerol lipase
MTRVARPGVATPPVTPAQSATTAKPAGPARTPKPDGWRESLVASPAEAVAVHAEVRPSSAAAAALWGADAAPTTVLTLAQGLLKQLGRGASATEAQQLLDGTPTLARRLAMLAGASADVVARHVQVNAPGAVPGAAGDATADASAYARDLGFQGFSLQNGHGMLATAAGPIDLGALPANASLDTLGHAINQQRFGTPSVVAPPPLQPSNDFKIDNAHLAVHLSSLAYRDEATVKSQLAQWGYDTSTFSWLEDKNTDTQGFVVNDKDGNTFVTFRGTESLRDAKTDAQATQVAAPWAGPGVFVHEGFSSALDSVWPQVQTAVKKARGDGTRGDVIFTGHSLGAGLTTLAALRATNEQLTPGDPRTKIFPIASPRTGDDAFMQQYNQKLPQTYRVVNFASGTFADTQDIVTQVPPKALGYRHVGNAIALSDGDFKVIRRDSPGGSPMLALEAVSVSPHGDRSDATNARVESLSGDALEKYMMQLAMDNREGQPPPRAPANAMALESMSLTMPSVSFHRSGEYLRRTGASVLKE